MGQGQGVWRGLTARREVQISDGAGKGVLLGLVLGAAAGGLASLDVIVMPVLAPAVAAGWWVAMIFAGLVGAAIGAGAGGLLGAAGAGRRAS